MHEPVKSNLPTKNKRMHMHVHDIPQVEKRAEHFNFTDHSPVLEC